MTVTIRPGDPREPAATALLQASHALMQSLYAPEENHYLSIGALTGPTIRFFIAETQENTVGCAALALMEGYGEVKSMFVAKAARRSGTADALLRHLETEARANGLKTLRLETGDTLHAAHKLYTRHGFRARSPFGDYCANATSLFMEKSLT